MGWSGYLSDPRFDLRDSFSFEIFELHEQFLMVFHRKNFNCFYRYLEISIKSLSVLLTKLFFEEAYCVRNKNTHRKTISNKDFIFRLKNYLLWYHNNILMIRCHGSGVLDLQSLEGNWYVESTSTCINIPMRSEDISPSSIGLYLFKPFISSKYIFFSLNFTFGYFFSFFLLISYVEDLFPRYHIFICFNEWTFSFAK